MEGTMPLSPVGIIQKNKDWNPSMIISCAPTIVPVGIIQKNKDWNGSAANRDAEDTLAGRHHPEEQGLKLRIGDNSTEINGGR